MCRALASKCALRSLYALTFNEPGRHTLGHSNCKPIRKSKQAN